MVRGVLVAVMVNVACSAPAPTQRVAPRAIPVAAPHALSPEVARWVANLDDPAQAGHAASELERLGDPAALEPLMNAWRRHHEVAFVDAIVSLASPADEVLPRPPAPPTTSVPPEEIEPDIGIGIDDEPHPARAASWDKVAPVLMEVVRAANDSDEDSVRAATEALRGLLAGQVPGARDALVELSKRVRASRTTGLDMLVLVLVRDDPSYPRLDEALASIVERDPPAWTYALEDPATRHVENQRRAIDAIGERGYATAIPSLLGAMYRYPELLRTIRVALVKLGPPARDALRKVLRGEDPAIEQLVSTLRLDRACGDTAGLPPDPCETYAARDAQAAVALAGFAGPDVTAELLAVLARPSRSAWPTSAGPGPWGSQHVQILDALAERPSPDFTAAIKRFWMSGTKEERIQAFAAYVRTTSDPSQLAAIAAIARDPAVDNDVRAAAFEAFANLATSKAHLKLYLALIKKWQDIAKQRDAKAIAARSASDRAFTATMAAQAPVDAAQAVANGAPGDAEKAAALKRAQATLQQTQVTYEQAGNHSADLSRNVSDLATSIRIAEAQVPRILVALRCKQDRACFESAASRTNEQIAEDAKPYTSNQADWRPYEKGVLIRAERERAELEIAKRWPPPPER